MPFFSCLWLRLKSAKTLFLAKPFVSLIQASATLLSLPPATLTLRPEYHVSFVKRKERNPSKPLYVLCDSICVPVLAACLESHSSDTDPAPVEGTLSKTKFHWFFLGPAVGSFSAPLGLAPKFVGCLKLTREYGTVVDVLEIHREVLAMAN
jgi:hypothetical protein